MTTMQLVFSDEFNADGHDLSVQAGDKRWTAHKMWYDATADCEVYRPEQVTTAGGAAVITMENKTVDAPVQRTDGSVWNVTKPYVSGFFDSWNKFCFTGGYLEAELQFPGDNFHSGFWPAFWLMGNLGRAGYMQSTKGFWPFTYNQCGGGDAGLESPEAVAPQLISACPDSDPPGFDCTLYNFKQGVGRGAPEIDMVEVKVSASVDETVELGGPDIRRFGPYTDPAKLVPVSKGGQKPEALNSMTLQVAPFLPNGTSWNNVTNPGGISGPGPLGPGAAHRDPRSRRHQAPLATIFPPGRRRNFPPACATRARPGSVLQERHQGGLGQRLLAPGLLPDLRGVRRVRRVHLGAHRRRGLEQHLRAQVLWLGARALGAKRPRLPPDRTAQLPRHAHLGCGVRRRQRHPSCRHGRRLHTLHLLGGRPQLRGARRRLAAGGCSSRAALVVTAHAGGAAGLTAGLPASAATNANVCCTAFLPPRRAAHGGQRPSEPFQILLCIALSAFLLLLSASSTKSLPTPSVYCFLLPMPCSPVSNASCANGARMLLPSHPPNACQPLVRSLAYPAPAASAKLPLAPPIYSS